MAVQVWQIVTWLVCIPYAVWYMWKEYCVGKREQERERVLVMELRQQSEISDYKEWRRCEHGCFAKTSALFCVKHDAPVRFVAIGMLADARLRIILSSEEVTQRFPESEREQLGAAFLELEEVGGMWDSEQTVALYNVRKRSQTIGTSND